jgi:hypothetical protein
MAVADPPSPPVRGQKTRRIPCSPEEDPQAVADPDAFRRLRDPRSESAPERFPPASRRGSRMKHVSHCRTTGGDLRRIELRTLQCDPVRPCFVMP